MLLTQLKVVTCCFVGVCSNQNNIQTFGVRNNHGYVISEMVILHDVYIKVTEVMFLGIQLYVIIK